MVGFTTATEAPLPVVGRLEAVEAVEVGVVLETANEGAVAVNEVGLLLLSWLEVTKAAPAKEAGGFLEAGGRAEAAPSGEAR